MLERFVIWGCPDARSFSCLPACVSTAAWPLDKAPKVTRQKRGTTAEVSDPSEPLGAKRNSENDKKSVNYDTDKKYREHRDNRLRNQSTYAPLHHSRSRTIS